MCDMKTIQKPFTVEEQIQNLKDINLIIEDEEKAYSFLSQVSYYRLIKGYSKGLKEDGRFKNGVTFDWLIELYEFNNELRKTLLPILERIELSLRCNIGNYFSIKYESKGSVGYTIKENFENDGNYNSVYKKLEDCKERAKGNEFIKHFENEYVDGNPPFYALVEVLGFGTLSCFYSILI